MMIEINQQTSLFDGVLYDKSRHSDWNRESIRNLIDWLSQKWPLDRISNISLNWIEKISNEDLYHLFHTQDYQKIIFASEKSWTQITENTIKLLFLQENLPQLFQDEKMKRALFFAYAAGDPYLKKYVSNAEDDNCDCDQFVHFVHQKTSWSLLYKNRDIQKYDKEIVQPWDVILFASSLKYEPSKILVTQRWHWDMKNENQPWRDRAHVRVGHLENNRFIPDKEDSVFMTQPQKWIVTHRTFGDTHKHTQRMNFMYNTTPETMCGEDIFISRKMYHFACYLWDDRFMSQFWDFGKWGCMMITDENFIKRSYDRFHTHKKWILRPKKK